MTIAIVMDGIGLEKERIHESRDLPDFEYNGIVSTGWIRYRIDLERIAERLLPVEENLSMQTEVFIMPRLRGS